MKKSGNFESIFRAISLPCLVLKPEEGNFLIVDANDAYLKLTGSAPEDLLGKLAGEAFPQNPDDSHGAELLLESINKVVLHKEKDKVELLRYDLQVRSTGEFLEKYWNFENVPILDPLGDLECILHLAQDVTAEVLLGEKKQKFKKEFENSQQQLNHFVDANKDGLYSMDREGNFLDSNQGLADMAEVPLEKLLEMNFLPFCAPEDRDFVLEHFSMAIDGRSNKFEAKFISAKGNPVILEISLAPMKSEGRITGAYGIARDLTPLRQSEKVIVTKKNYLQANAAFINGLLKNDLEQSALQEPLSMIGEAVNIDRIYYYEAHPCPDTGGNPAQPEC